MTIAVLIDSTTVNDGFPSREVSLDMPARFAGSIAFVRVSECFEFIIALSSSMSVGLNGTAAREVKRGRPSSYLFRDSVSKASQSGNAISQLVVDYLHGTGRLPLRYPDLSAPRSFVRTLQKTQSCEDPAVDARLCSVQSGCLLRAERTTCYSRRRLGHLPPPEVATSTRNSASTVAFIPAFGAPILASCLAACRTNDARWPPSSTNLGIAVSAPSRANVAFASWTLHYVPPTLVLRTVCQFAILDRVVLECPHYPRFEDGYFHPGVLLSNPDFIIIIRWPWRTERGPLLQRPAVVFSPQSDPRTPVTSVSIAGLESDDVAGAIVRLQGPCAASARTIQNTLGLRQMADIEFRAAQLEPTFVKPLDTASRRRSRASRASHDSAAASTRSWVLMTQQAPPPPVEPIPVPEPVPALAPTPGGSRPLPEPPRRTSMVLDESGAEHMTVDLPPAVETLGYQWTTGRGAKVREKSKEKEKEGKGFVGGFVSGLRRLPRALVRPRRARRGTTNTEGTDGTEGTGMSGNTLPRYVSTPPTPVVAGPPVGFVQGTGGLVAPEEHAEEGRRRRHPSFRVDPPREDMQRGAAPIVCDPDAQEGHGDGEGGPSVLELPQSPMENPYDREGVTPTTYPSSHVSHADDLLAAPAPEGDGDEPVSVHVHPLPTEDYRRMSAADAAQPQSRTTITSASFTADSPSFSSELNGVHRFLAALHVLPWVAPERVTVDYRPKTKPKVGVSWYRPEGEGEGETEQVHARTRDLDATSTSPASASNAPRARSPPRQRTHRRATTSPSMATPVPYGGYPFAYYPPPIPSPSPPPIQGGRRRRASPRRQHRRSATYHPTSPIPGGSWAPMLPAPPAPVYIIQASPAPTASPPPPPGSGSMHATPGSGTTPSDGGGGGTGKHMQMLGLAPVYMQMQLVPGSAHQLAFVASPGSAHGSGNGSAGYAHGYGGYGYGSGYGSPIAMPPPVQTVGMSTMYVTHELLLISPDLAQCKAVQTSHHFFLNYHVCFVDANLLETCGWIGVQMSPTVDGLRQTRMQVGECSFRKFQTRKSIRVRPRKTLEHNGKHAAINCDSWKNFNGLVTICGKHNKMQRPTILKLALYWLPPITVGQPIPNLYDRYRSGLVVTAFRGPVGPGLTMDIG
ncbi:hypothetical protein B0H19DRAFT_1064373 [Mycena capillaripes]|nr:hypothetical protein B0H19DRAFT_1064373 [Mycena capillaripes]